MFTQEEVRKIAQSSDTAKTVFDVLSKRRRFRRQTNLDKFHQILLNQGCSIVEDDYIDIFKKLDKMQVGALIYGRNGKANRFRWNYNLKNVANAAMGNKVEVFQELGKKTRLVTEAGEPIAKRKPGRPVGSTSKAKFTANDCLVEITLRIPAEMLNMIEIFRKTA